MAILNYRDLRVWQLAMNISVEVYRITSGFPRYELFGLTSQIRRAAVSIPSNIGEGHSRDHTGEYLYFLSISAGSLAELQTQLELSKRLSYLPNDVFLDLNQDLTKLWKQMRALRNSLRKMNNKT